MLTGFRNCATQQKVKEEQKKKNEKQIFMRKLLSEALHEAVVEDNFRVHIEGEPFRVEFKFPENYNLPILKKELEANRLVAFESKILASEILVHTFKIAPLLNEIVEVLYRPISRPRM